MRRITFVSTGIYKNITRNINDVHLAIIIYVFRKTMSQLTNIYIRALIKNVASRSRILPAVLDLSSLKNGKYTYPFPQLRPGPLPWCDLSILRGQYRAICPNISHCQQTIYVTCTVYIRSILNWLKSNGPFYS